MSTSKFISLSMLSLILTICFISHAYDRRTPIVQAFEQNKKAVLNISTETIVQRSDTLYRYDPFFGFYGRGFNVVREVPLNSLGSGFIIDARGYIMTNAHVVNGATTITVIQADKKEVKAQVVAIDNQSDIALLKIETTDKLTSVKLWDGTPEELFIGETALAIGNPLGYQHTITDGVVSAIHRELAFENDVVLGDMIQISTPIYPGNSGGPLLNINGELIGMNTAINKAAQGIGFAIPVSRFQTVLPKLINLDTIGRINVGLEVKENKEEGVVVSHLAVDGGAQGAGLQLNDLIIAVNQNKIISVLGFYFEMLENKDKSEIVFSVKRVSQKKMIDIEMPLVKKPKPDTVALSERLYGMTLGELTVGLINKYHINGDPDDVIVIKSPKRGTTAYAVGIEVEDIITRFNGQKVRSLEALGSLLENIGDNQTVKMVIQRTERDSFGSLYIRDYEVTIKSKSTKENQQELFSL